MWPFVSARTLAIVSGNRVTMAGGELMSGSEFVPPAMEVHDLVTKGWAVGSPEAERMGQSYWNFPPATV